MININVWILLFVSININRFVYMFIEVCGEGKVIYFSVFKISGIGMCVFCGIEVI